jgi:multicomponent Na+:H+ antiporter subunit C
MTAALAAGLLVTGGVYLILQRGLVRVAFGFVLLGHAANIIVVSAGGMGLRAAPLLGHADTEDMADPLPQAFVLTAIVITFGITVYLLAMARGGGEDDPGRDALDPDAPDRADEPDRDWEPTDWGPSEWGQEPESSDRTDGAR